MNTVTRAALLAGFADLSLAKMKFLLLNDIHLNLDDKNMPEPGNETTMPLLEKVLEDAVQQADRFGKFDAILLLGDLCKHDIAAEVGTPITEVDWKPL